MKQLNPLVTHPLWRTLADTTTAEGMQAYLVGGAIRDCLLGNVSSDSPIKDWDIVLTSKTGDSPLDETLQARVRHLAQAICTQLKGHYVLLDETWGIHRIVLDEDNPVLPQGGCIDLACALDNSIETDLARRDLTINSMAIPLTTDTSAFKLMDPHGGQADLETQTIRMLSEGNMIEDPLRLLRVFRFGTLFSSPQWHLETLACVNQHRALINQSAAERIQTELLKLFSARVCFPAVEAMALTGLLESIFPELVPTREVPPNTHHHLGLFEHTLELIRQSEHLFEELPQTAQTSLLESLNGTVNRFGIVKLACLLHDIGKPQTMQVLSESKTTFYGHEQLSATMGDEISQRLKLSSDLSQRVHHLVRWHLYPCQFGPESPLKSVLRFYRRIGEAVPDLILLALADRYSTQGPAITPEMMQTAHQNHLWLLDEYYAQKPVLSLPRLLNGNQIMEALQRPPGPWLKTVLDTLTEAQQLGEIQTEEQALAWVKKAQIPETQIPV
ncbi:MAG: HD domain-containing protein [Cyanobacteria bacterium]|nr:HD domain-containing protein [Cyanobacteriota bacterium]